MHRRLILLALLLVVACLSCSMAQSPEASTEPATTNVTQPPVAQRRVLVISVDGLRPDLLIPARTPHLHELVRSGSYTFWANTTDLANTLPSHVSMMTGATPLQHGVFWNREQPPAYIRENLPRVPTLFELAKRAGLTTAMAAGKQKFHTLVKPGTIDWLSVPDANSDEQVARQAVQFIEQHQPQVMLVHLPMVDATGHQSGWGSPSHLAVVEAADRALGLVLDALDRHELRSGTLLIVTADHGGRRRSHGGTDLRSRHVPWVANGPGVKAGHDLTLEEGLEVRIEDTFATAAHYLGLTVSEVVQGKPVLQIYQDHQPAPEAAGQPVKKPASTYGD